MKILIRFIMGVVLSLLIMKFGPMIFENQLRGVGEKESPDGKYKVVLRHPESGPLDFNTYEYVLFSREGMGWKQMQLIRCEPPLDTQIVNNDHIRITASHHLLGWEDNTHFKIQVSTMDSRFKDTTETVYVLYPRIPCLPDRNPQADLYRTSPNSNLYGPQPSGSKTIGPM